MTRCRWVKRETVPWLLSSMVFKIRLTTTAWWWMSSVTSGKVDGRLGSYPSGNLGELVDHVQIVKSGKR